MSLRALSRICFAVLGLALVGGSSGCVTAAATKSGFTESWDWASRDDRSVVLASPWSDAKVTVQDREDHVLAANDDVIAAPVPLGSHEAEACLVAARRCGHAIDDGDVLGIYELTKEWRLPGCDEDVKVLVIARRAEAPYVLAGTGRRWLRCRASELVWKEGSVIKRTAVIAGWIPIWTTLGAVDVVLICSVVGLVIA